MWWYLVSAERSEDARRYIVVGPVSDATLRAHIAGDCAAHKGTRILRQSALRSALRKTLTTK